MNYMIYKLIYNLYITLYFLYAFGATMVQFISVSIGLEIANYDLGKFFNRFKFPGDH